MGQKEKKKWNQIRKQCLKRDSHRCRIKACKTPTDQIGAHHIVPRDQGGGDSLPNLISLCETHHNMVEPLWQFYSTPGLIENLVYVGPDDKSRTSAAPEKVTWQMVVYGGYHRRDLEPWNQKWRQEQSWYKEKMKNGSQ